MVLIFVRECISFHLTMQNTKMPRREPAATLLGPLGCDDRGVSMLPPRRVNESRRLWLLHLSTNLVAVPQPSPTTSFSPVADDIALAVAQHLRLPDEMQPPIHFRLPPAAVVDEADAADAALR